MSPTLLRLWVALAALSAGTVYGWDAPGSPAPAIGCAGLLSAATVARRGAVRTIGLVGLCFALGAANAAARSGGAGVLEMMARDVPSCSVTGRVLEAAGGLGTLVAIRRAVCEGGPEVTEAGAVFVEGQVGEAGAAIRAKGWIVPLGEDSFGRARRRLGAGASFEPVELTTTSSPAGAFAVAAALRGGVETATQAWDQRRAALLEGLTIGKTSGLDPATVEDFRRAGLAHLLAVSGTNVAIVLGAVALAARRLPQVLRIGAGAVALGLFVLTVGPDPSVLRAAIMGAIGLAAVGWGRRAEPLHGLALAVIVLIGARPAMVFSVGLYLSGAATAGIVLWTKPLAARLALLPDVIAVPLAATLAAQAAVAPILMVVFGELSFAAPVANLAALPVVAPATLGGLAAACAAVAGDGLGATAARPLEPLVGWLLWVGDALGPQPWASVAVARPLGWVAAVPVLIAAARAMGEMSAADRSGKVES